MEQGLDRVGKECVGRLFHARQTGGRGSTWLSNLLPRSARAVLMMGVMYTYAIYERFLLAIEPGMSVMSIGEPVSMRN